MADRLLSPSKITAWLDCGHYLTLRERLDAGLLEAERRRVRELRAAARRQGVPARGRVPGALPGRGAQRLRGSRPGVRRALRRLGRPRRQPVGRRVRRHLPDALRARRHARDRRLPAPRRQPCRRRVLLRAARCQARPHRGQARARPPAVLLRRRPRRRNRYRPRAPAPVARVGAHRVTRHEGVPSLLEPAARPAAAVARGRRARAGDTARRRVPTASSASSSPSATRSGARRTRSSTSPASGGTRSAGLEDCAITTLAGLAECTGAVDSLRPERLERLVSQAELQVEARDDPDGPPPFHLTEAGADPTWGRGLELLPEPDDGDVFLDFEGDPFWTVESWTLLPVRPHRTRSRRCLDVRGPLGPRPRRGGAGHQGAHRVPGEPPSLAPGHARLPLQPHGAVCLGAPRGRSRRRRSGIVRDGGDGILRRPVPGGPQCDPGRHGVVRLEGCRTAHRLRARARDRPGCGRRRRVRAVHGRARPRRPRAHRGLQRGRRPGHAGPAGLARRPAAHRPAVACGPPGAGGRASRARRAGRRPARLRSRHTRTPPG